MTKSLKNRIIELIEQSKPEKNTSYHISETIYNESKGDISRASVGKTLENMEKHDLEKKWKDTSEGGFWYYKKI